MPWGFNRHDHLAGVFSDADPGPRRQLGRDLFDRQPELIQADIVVKHLERALPGLIGIPPADRGAEVLRRPGAPPGAFPDAHLKPPRRHRTFHQQDKRPTQDVDDFLRSARPLPLSHGEQRSSAGEDRQQLGRGLPRHPVSCT